jgi:hypothetical protein
VLEEVGTTLASSGVLGAITVALGWAYWRQAQKLAEVYEARVRDAQAMTQTLLTEQRTWQETVGELRDVIARLAEARARNGSGGGKP